MLSTTGPERIPSWSGTVQVNEKDDETYCIQLGGREGDNVTFGVTYEPKSKEVTLGGYANDITTCGYGRIRNHP